MERPTGKEALETITLLAGSSSDGRPAREELLVQRVGPMQFQVLRSPGLVEGIAAGDRIECSEDGTFRVLERGGNLCIQIFRRGPVAELETVLTARLLPLGGRLDGKTPRVLVYTVPVNAGFPAIESALRESIAAFPETEWYFGNVYDPADGITPLNWWV